MATRYRRRSSSSNIWPGFVDAISTLLIIVIFLLMVFTIAQVSLSEILNNRNDALDRLNRQVAELAGVLALEKASNKNLRKGMEKISVELKNSITTKSILQKSLTVITMERDHLAETLLIRERQLKIDRGKNQNQLVTIQSLRNDIQALEKVRKTLEKKVGSLANSLERKKMDLNAARDRSKKLKARLATAQEQTILAQQEIKQRDVRLEQIQHTADKAEKSFRDQKKLSQKARDQIILLNQQIALLRAQLAKISSALEVSEAKSESKNVQIVNLGKRLNQALANKVQELDRFRSEFFGKLRYALGNTKGVRIEGDRFVIQSEILFPSGSATMFGAGEKQISQLAKMLKSISSRIPKDIDWILRVDGHTDNRPIKTLKFPSNWELSASRAIAVVKQLIEQGIPPHRIAATGFGKFRPLNTSDNPEGLSRNRRIEFKLTGR